MKTTYYLMLVFVMFVTSCQTKKEPAPVDPVAVKLEVTKMLNDLDSILVKAKDVEKLMTFYTDDAVFCGSDPSEIWGKTEYAEEMKKMLTDSTSFINFMVDYEIIQVDKTGTSVNVSKQFVPNWSKPIPVRGTFHLVKQDNKWQIDFSSFGLIPLNKDLPKLRATY